MIINKITIENSVKPPITFNSGLFVPSPMNSNVNEAITKNRNMLKIAFFDFSFIDIKNCVKSNPPKLNTKTILCQPPRSYQKLKTKKI